MAGGHGKKISLTAADKKDKPHQWKMLKINGYNKWLHQII